MALIVLVRHRHRSHEIQRRSGLAPDGTHRVLGGMQGVLSYAHGRSQVLGRPAGVVERRRQLHRIRLGGGFEPTRRRANQLLQQGPLNCKLSAGGQNCGSRNRPFGFGLGDVAPRALADLKQDTCLPGALLERGQRLLPQRDRMLG